MNFLRLNFIVCHKFEIFYQCMKPAMVYVH